jgi:hypothetical protein
MVKVLILIVPKPVGYWAAGNGMANAPFFSILCGCIRLGMNHE